MYSWLLVSLIFTGGSNALKPVLRPEGEVFEKVANESFAVLCTFPSTPKSDQKEVLTWTSHSGKPIASSGRVHVETRANIGSMLLFDRVEGSESGRYTCTASNKESVSFELKVFRPIDFGNTPTTHRVNENQNSIIKCIADGEPKPTITWLRNGVSIEVDPKKYIPIDKGLRMNNALRSDSGNITCRAMQVGMTVASYMKDFEIKIEVLHKPEWREPTSGTEHAYGYLGGETNLTCEALANPPANYTWFRNSKEVKNNRHFTVIEVVERHSSVLRIFVQDTSLFGQFQCEARNFLGTIKRSFELFKGDKPPPPSHFRVLRTRVHEAVLEVEGGSDDPQVRGYRAQFLITRPGQEISWDKPEFQDMKKTSEGHYKIIDLLENTSYIVRLSRRGAAGLSDFTNNTEIFRTKKTGVADSTTSIVPLPLAILMLTNLLAVSLAVH